MHIKNLTLWNTKAKPWFTENINLKSKYWKSVLLSQIPELTNEEGEMYVIILNETYGYRTGLLGYIFTYLSNLNIYKPTFLTKMLNNKYYFVNNNLHTNDYDIISFFFTRLTSFFPILNYGFWDYKSLFDNILTYKTVNNTYPSIFNLFSPYLDNGICFFSNKKPIESGFKKLNTINSSLEDCITNRGIEWLVYKNNDKVIIILSFNLSDNMDDVIKLQEIYQIVHIHDIIEDRYKNFKIESFILGNFKVEISHQIKNMFYDFNLIETINNKNYMFFKSQNNTSVKSTISDISINPIINFELTTNIELEEIIVEKKETLVDNENKNVAGYEKENNNEQHNNKNALKIQKFFKSLVEKKKKKKIAKPPNIFEINLSSILSNYFISNENNVEEQEKETSSPSSNETDESWDRTTIDEITI
jgi:hypothetical protein